MLLVLLLCSPSSAGTLPDWTPSTEAQQGIVPAAWSGDGQTLAITGWDRAGLALLDTRTGQVQVLSHQRGAGFAPAWTAEGWIAKEIEPHGQSLVRFGSEVLDEGARVGDVSVAGDLLAWTHDRTLTVEGPQGSRSWHLPDYVNLVALHPGGAHLALADGDGYLAVLDLHEGHVRWLGGGAGHSHPAWSKDGELLLSRSPGGWFGVHTLGGQDLLEVEGQEPAWVGDHLVVSVRRDGDLLGLDRAELWLTDARTGASQPLPTPGLHPHHPLPGAGGIAFTDTAGGGLWWAPLEQGHLGQPRLLLSQLDLRPAPPPPSPHALLDMPYVHQVYDTPDDFPGYWSCGPTSCIMVAQRSSLLPDHDITVSTPEPHTSHWGWYIPTEYEYAGYTYDTWGITWGDVWCQGAHGFICREYGGAVGQYLIDWLNQHGVESYWGGVEWSTLAGELDDGQPMVVLMDLLDASHLVAARGYGADHAFTVNEPYGDGNLSPWCQYNGEAVVYDWQGYNNGHLEVEVTYLFGARDPAVVAWAAELVEVDAPEVLHGEEEVEVTVVLANTGTATWTHTVLGTAEPQGRESELASDRWEDATVAARVEGEVLAGDEAAFTFTLVGPSVSADTPHVEAFQLQDQTHGWFGPVVEVSLVLSPPLDNEAPVAVAEALGEAVAGEPLTLSGAGSWDPDGELVQWEWDTPSGPLSGEEVEWVPRGAGLPMITLTVTDDRGATASADLLLEVLPSEGGGGCSCASGRQVGWIALLAVLGWIRRRR